MNFTVIYLLAAFVGYLSSLASDTASLAYLGRERLSQTGQREPLRNNQNLIFCKDLFRSKLVNVESHSDFT